MFLPALLYRQRGPPYDDTSTDEFLAMTFVHGPAGVMFSDEKPAKLRFFLGCVDDLVPADDGAGQASLSLVMLHFNRALFLCIVHSWC